MPFLRYALGIPLILAGLCLAGVYLAGEFAAGSWPGTSPNPAVRFFQSSFFLLAGKPPLSLAALAFASAFLLAGALLARMFAALLFAAAAGCLGVAGAAWVSFSLERSGGPLTIPSLSEALPGLVDRDGRDAGIVLGLGFSLLLLAVFAGGWGRFNARRRGRRDAEAAARNRPSKPPAPRSGSPREPTAQPPEEESAFVDPPPYDGLGDGGAGDEKAPDERPNDKGE